MNLRDRDNLRTKDKRPAPKVSFLRRFDCIYHLYLDNAGTIDNPIPVFHVKGWVILLFLDIPALHRLILLNTMQNFSTFPTTSRHNAYTVEQSGGGMSLPPPPHNSTWPDDRLITLSSVKVIKMKRDIGIVCANSHQAWLVTLLDI